MEQSVYLCLDKSGSMSGTGACLKSLLVETTQQVVTIKGINNFTSPLAYFEVRSIGLCGIDSIDQVGKDKKDKGQAMAEQTSIKIPTFDGKAKNFAVWFLRFKAYAAVKMFLPALQDGGEPEMPPDEATPLDPNDPDEKKQLEAKKRNALAMASFTMAFTTHALMMYIHRAVTGDWPSGLAWMVVRLLCNQYRP